MSTALRPTAAEVAPALRRLHLTRFAFALAWAGLLVVTGGRPGPATAVLVVLYPLFDAACAVVDARATGSSRTPRALHATVAVSSLAAIALGVAAAADVPAILRVWGAWAIVAGVLQLVVGIGRRALGGQWPMLLSGGLSVLAGTGFALMAGGPDPSLLGVAGYAALGGVFFLVSALRLGRATAEHRPS